MGLNRLLSCSDAELDAEIGFLMGACNGVALLNSLLQFQKTLTDTRDRNEHPITCLVLYKLMSLSDNKRVARSNS